MRSLLERVREDLGDYKAFIKKLKKGACTCREGQEDFIHYERWACGVAVFGARSKDYCAFFFVTEDDDFFCIPEHNPTKSSYEEFKDMCSLDVDPYYLESIIAALQRGKKWLDIHCVKNGPYYKGLKPAFLKRR